jgi:hypothetical protein
MIFSPMGVAVVKFEGNPHERIHQLGYIGNFWQALPSVGCYPRSRQRSSAGKAPAAALEISTRLQVELPSFKDRDSRIPELDLANDILDHGRGWRDRREHSLPRSGLIAT